MSVFYILSLVLLINFTHSHSWLECTKYTGDLETFDRSACLNKPRPLDANGRNVGNTFGADIGMDYRPAASGANPCQGDSTLGINGNYNNNNPLVEYEAGKTYTLAWAPKNHVAAECTNAFIPDNFLKIFSVPYNENGQADPNQSSFRQTSIPSSFESDPHVSGQIDFKGFQNCPKFCENTDKALCTGTITIPTDMPLGLHTMQWYWAFNSPTDLYATCWEARIVANTGGNDPVVTLPPANTPDCTNCCLGASITAPGTGQLVNYNNVNNGDSLFLTCPNFYTGTFKIMCVNEEIRVVDGFCEPNGSVTNTPVNGGDGGVVVVTEKESADSGAIAGLSVTLVFVLLAFCLYVMFTQGFLQFDDFCVRDQEKKLSPYQSPYQTSSPQQQQKRNPMSNNISPEKRGRVDSVVTQSNTMLPIVPLKPIVSKSNWHHTTKTDETIGPVDDIALAKYCNSIGFDTAIQNIYVWDGETVNEWTAINQVDGLVQRLKTQANKI